MPEARFLIAQVDHAAARFAAAESGILVGQFNWNPASQLMFAQSERLLGLLTRLE
jgi:hypothetical protein